LETIFTEKASPFSGETGSKNIWVFPSQRKEAAGSGQRGLGPEPEHLESYQQTPDGERTQSEGEKHEKFDPSIVQRLLEESPGQFLEQLPHPCHTPGVGVGAKVGVGPAVGEIHPQAGSQRLHEPKVYKQVYPTPPYLVTSLE